MPDKTLTLNIEIDKFQTFLSYIKELSLIDPTTVISFNNDYTMLYSFVGKDINDIHAFKTVIIKTDEIFNKFKEIENKILFIIKDNKKFTRNIQNFIDFDENIKMKISFDEENYYSNYLNISNSKLRLKEISGDPVLMSKEITKEDINFLTDKNKSLFNFEISELDFRKIKSMSNIDTTNDILYITINNNELFIGENKWELKICDIDKPNLSISFPKKYFKNLKFTDNTKIYIYENYILISDDNTDLMIVLETTV